VKVVEFSGTKRGSVWKN